MSLTERVKKLENTPPRKTHTAATEMSHEERLELIKSAAVILDDLGLLNTPPRSADPDDLRKWHMIRQIARTEQEE